MSRIAVIDLGTNTFNLLVVEVAANNTYVELFQTKIAVKLAEGGMSKGFIAPVAFQRGINAIKEYRKIAEEYQVEKIVAFATSAIRSASNGHEFVQQVKQEMNIDVQVISGDTEAELIYLGVRSAVKMNDDCSLIIDIGGGSTEFIIANKNKIIWKQSFLLGVARLLERFEVSDPIADTQIKTITNYLQQELQSLYEAVKKYPVTELIGSSGSFDSLAEMIAHRFYSIDVLKDKTEIELHLKDFNAIYQSILKSTLAERLEMKGLTPMRVDMIVVSSILVQFVIETLNVQQVRLSTYSLKEGVLQKILE